MARTYKPLVPVAERFWNKVEKTDTCWLWIGARGPTGYGHVGLGPRKTGNAHRVAYELLVGTIPEGFQLDHLCRVRNCVNPAHLEPVTPAENSRRGITATRTHCPHGHPFDAENTRITPRGYRRCRTCDLRNSRNSGAKIRKNETPAQLSERQRRNANKRWHPELTA